VVFKVHNNTKGFPLAKSDLKTPKSRQRMIRFPPVEELSDSIAEEDDTTAEALLSKGMDVNSRGTQGSTPLHRYVGCIDSILVGEPTGCRQSMHRQQLQDCYEASRSWS
jgi:hypothetical protein